MDILGIFGHFYLNHLSPLWGYFYLSEVCVDVCGLTTKMDKIFHNGGSLDTFFAFNTKLSEMRDMAKQ